MWVVGGRTGEGVRVGNVDEKSLELIPCTRPVTPRKLITPVLRLPAYVPRSHRSVP